MILIVYLLSRFRTKHYSSIRSGAVQLTMSSLHILHYNDVYNIESRATEPAGGAARFTTAVKQFSHLEPLVSWATLTNITITS